MDQIEALKKKAIFQSARRAILENEVFLREWVTKHLPEHYGIDELERLNVMLTKIFDNDLFDVVMGNKQPNAFEGMYDQELLTDIADFADEYRAKIKAGEVKAKM